MARPIRFRTAGFNGYAVEFSPFFENRLACASAANFGIAGNGRLWVLRAGPDGAQVERIYDTQDGLFDCAWSEVHENQLVTCSGDGSIKLWDLSLPVRLRMPVPPEYVLLSAARDFPVRNWAEHKREVFTVNWNLVRKDTFITGSWDYSIKMWNPEMPNSIRTWQEHIGCIYQTVWSPTSPDVFASVGDQTLKIWDVRQQHSVQTIRAHNAEILALDWAKYQKDRLVTGSVDTTIKIWDLRFPGREAAFVGNHEYAVRRVKCSPHVAGLIGSVSYDMTARFWDMDRPGNHLVHAHNDHSEFALGLDFSMFFRGQVATCGWDEMVHIFSV
ncbi:peroxisomal targeting signal 2 receptor [Polyrhizophydium stewartii]|uniref:Peroxin-7 n=1 Tax=Polyrhizophydium stewartii TaxID=2732419 RepID=A0ABR4N321_9FUNG